ncbi:hypothetical protein TruAng_005259 [Truncatella angustata]|nr:hypothetical protein TruAng_005259 [Truncatella angustata]
MAGALDPTIMVSEDDDAPDSHPTDLRVRKFRVTLKYTGTLSMFDLDNYMTSTDPYTLAFKYDKQPLIQALNIMLNDYAKQNYKNLIQVGGNKTYSVGTVAQTQDLTDGVKVTRGFFSSIRVTQARLLGNVNEGLRITTSHVQQDGRHIVMVKTISGLACIKYGGTGASPAGANDVKLWLKGQGCYVTATEFFLRKYGIKLKKADTQRSTSGTGNHSTYLPPEVSKVPSGRPTRRALSSTQTHNMIKFPFRRPELNKQTILSSNLSTVHGRVLPQPSIIYSSNAKAAFKDAGWNVQGKRFRTPKKLWKWSWIILCLHASVPCIATIVANVDTSPGQWPAALSLQDQARQEMSTGLKAKLKSRRRMWKSKAGPRPENVLAYRDGVSEGQYKLVVNKGWPLLQLRLAHYIIGLDEIFQCEVHRRRGLPTGYESVEDLVKMTQALCFVFGRATRAVSICTPAYDANITYELLG